MNLYKLNRSVHRDLGYFFFALTIIYAVSGIALNHRHEWNSNYIIRKGDFVLENELPRDRVNRQSIEEILTEIGLEAKYRTHVLGSDTLKVFVEGGSLNLDLGSGRGSYEFIRKRPIFNQFNFLHYNTPRKLWTWFADLYALGLILLALSGLFILKGKNGITGRGAWLTALGLIIPLAFLYFYS